MTSNGVGVWLGEDGQVRKVEPNLYRYVGNHPTNATDPSGLQEKKNGVTGPANSPINWNTLDLSKGVRGEFNPGVLGLTLTGTKYKVKTVSGVEIELFRVDPVALQPEKVQKTKGLDIRSQCYGHAF